MDQIVSFEPVVRVGAFVGAFVGLLLAERWAPRRPRTVSIGQRWVTNALLVVLDNVLLRGLALLAPVTAAVAAAAHAAEYGVGLLNIVQTPTWVRFSVALLALDCAIWLQHVAFHRVPALWWVHRVHHADRDVDVTTALRFHPIEIAISAAYKTVMVVALGAPAAAVIVFEIALNACAMFNHANLTLPRWLDAALRLILVTPDMHRVHHSVLRDEHNRNFGFCLSIWDRLFGLYNAQPRAGHDGMTIGLADCQTEAPSRLMWSLVLPFRR